MYELKSFLKLSALILLAVLLVMGCSNSTSSEDGNKSNDGNKETSADGEVKKIILGHPNAETHPMHKSYMQFKESVEEKTNGQIVVEVHHGGTLGGDRELAESVDTGTIQMALNGSMILGNYDSKFRIFDLPFIFDSYEEVDKIIEGPIGEQLSNVIEGTNIRVLSFPEAGFRDITTGKKEIKTAEDLEGIKIRALETPVHIAGFEALGMSPTSIPFPEVYSSLQSGVIDAQENSNSNTYHSKFYEVQSYLTTPGIFFLLDMTIINEDFYQSLTEEQQQIITESAIEAAKFQRELNREEETNMRELIAEEGVVINELSASEIERLKEKAKPVYDQFNSEIGEDFAKAVSEELGRNLFE